MQTCTFKYPFNVADTFMKIEAYRKKKSRTEPWLH